VAVNLEEWSAAVARELAVTPVETIEILDLARDVAHGVTRPAAPVTCLLVGLAVGAGADLDDVLSRVRALIPPDPAP
jgi:hypothetical protein